jgi:predicted transcriptional regulator of viral defense system
VEPAHYVAYASAAYLHGAANEVPFNPQVAAPRQHRPLRIGNARLTFHRVADTTWGTQRLRQGGAYVTVSDPERTLLDCAARPDLCGGADGLAQLAIELVAKVRPPVLAGYLRRLRKPGVANRLGFIFAHRSRRAAPLQRVLERARTRGRYRLDPDQPRQRARFDPTWRVWVNVDVEAWRRA